MQAIQDHALRLPNGYKPAGLRRMWDGANTMLGLVTRTDVHMKLETVRLH